MRFLASKRSLSMKIDIERAIDSLFDDYLKEFSAEHPIDDSFLTIYKDYKAA